MANHVANGVDTEWEIEEIPNQSLIYMRVHKNEMKNGKPLPFTFRIRPGHTGMSVDWDKYATPEETQLRAKNPADNAVIAMLVGDVRQIPEHEVLHQPISSNRAHSEVMGEKTTEARVLFSRLYKLVISLEGA
jgi:hypothetical protein